jgi:hypothetical protein
MGLLDDAIREHLELKRRRGADPDEIARQEDEALGDPRSGEFARPYDEEPAAALPEEEDLPPEPPEPAAYEPEPPEPEDEAPWLEGDRGEPGQPTAEFTPPDVEPEPEVVRPDDEPATEEDVLEETPDFLQETPEHDRLWFEQKPPRDFDFDN